MTFQELVSQLDSFGLAVITYYNNLPLNDPFWGSLTFEQWKEIYIAAPDDLPLSSFCLDKMNSMAESWSEWSIVFAFGGNNTPQRRAALKKLAELAETFENWQHLRSRADELKDGGLMTEAFAKMEALAKSFSHWSVLLNFYENSGSKKQSQAIAQMITTAEAPDEWRILLLRTNPEDREFNMALAALDKHFNDFYGWKNFAEREMSRKVRMAGLKRMLELASTLHECKIVHDLAHSNNHTDLLNATLKKLQGMEASLEEWEILRRSGWAELSELCARMMFNQAKTLSDWKTVFLYGNEAERKKAIEEIARLASP